MREWKFKNKIEVYEEEYDYSLHCFKVYMENKYLGSIYPSSLEDMEDCIRKLDNGEDPVFDRWEDGLGNICNIEGWGEAWENIEN